ncbi:MAG: PilZ domain-containing protein [Deltaproteobacteria bacterium]|nr:PilZ domain-containing protein [Nannocystaceae bacterium]
MGRAPSGAGGESEVSTSDKGRERRRARRVPMSTAFSELDPRTTTPVSDLSETGCYVHTADQLPTGSLIDLRFTVFPEEPILFEGRGKVVRHGDDPPGMGVQFIELDDSARDVVRKILLRDEAARMRPTMAQRHVGLRTHGLVARLVVPGPKRS